MLRLRVWLVLVVLSAVLVAVAGVCRRGPTVGWASVVKDQLRRASEGRL